MNGPLLPSLASELPYRLSVGMMLINSDGLVWLGRRLANAETGSSWQMPQGGVNAAEDPAVAALRELAEETGTDNAEILAQSREWLHYDLPPDEIGIALNGKYRGQRQRWFALRYLGRDEDFNIHNPPGGHPAEFDAWRWALAAEAVSLIVAFKRPVYEAVVSEFRSLLR